MCPQIIGGMQRARSWTDHASTPTMTRSGLHGPTGWRTTTSPPIAMIPSDVPIVVCAIALLVIAVGVTVHYLKGTPRDSDYYEEKP